VVLNDLDRHTALGPRRRAAASRRDHRSASSSPSAPVTCPAR